MTLIKEPKIRENIGGLLREYRIRNGISQNKLSTEVNLSRTFINLIENGHRLPSIDTVEKIATKLGIS